MGIVNAAVFASGILADGDVSQRVAYKAPNEEMVIKVKNIKEVCKKYDVPIGAVALQFSLRDPRIHSTVVGVSSPAQVEENIRLSQMHIPDGLWDELKNFTITDRDPEVNN